MEAEKDDVDVFIQYSLSVHNRRKSRVGFAFENHLETVFMEHGLVFEKGSRCNVLYNEMNNGETVAKITGWVCSREVEFYVEGSLTTNANNIAS